METPMAVRTSDLPPKPLCCGERMITRSTAFGYHCEQCGYVLPGREHEHFSERLGDYRLTPYPEGGENKKMAQPICEHGEPIEHEVYPGGVGCEGGVGRMRREHRVNTNKAWRNPEGGQANQSNLRAEMLRDMEEAYTDSPYEEKKMTVNGGAKITGEIVFKNGSKLTVKRDSGGKHVGHLEGVMPTGESVPAQVVDDRWTIGWDVAEGPDECVVVVFDRGEQRAVQTATWRDGRPQIIRLANGASIRYGPRIGWHLSRQPKDDCKLCDSTVKGVEDQIKRLDDETAELGEYRIEYAVYQGQPAHADCFVEWEAKQEELAMRPGQQEAAPGVYVKEDNHADPEGEGRVQDRPSAGEAQDEGGGGTPAASDQGQPGQAQEEEVGVCVKCGAQEPYVQIQRRRTDNALSCFDCLGPIEQACALEYAHTIDRMNKDMNRPWVAEPESEPPDLHPSEGKGWGRNTSIFPI